MCIHCKGFLERWLTFEALRYLSFALFCHNLRMFTSSSRYIKSDSGRCEENLLVIEISLCYILKHLEDRKA